MITTMQMCVGGHHSLCNSRYFKKRWKLYIRSVISAARLNAAKHLLLPVVVLSEFAPESSRISKGFLVHLFIILPGIDSCPGFVLITLQLAQHAKSATSKLHSGDC